MRRALFVAVCMVLAMPHSPSSARGGECRQRNLALDLRLPDRRVHRGERVEMIMTVTNEGPACTMVWSDGQSFNFYVFDGDKKVWNQDECVGFTQAVVTEEWSAGHEEKYRSVWNQRLEGRGCPGRGDRAAPGRYWAQGHFMGDGEPRTEKVSFRIVD